ncbi:SGNH/GDSL hydrolase family protein [Allosalinactinospora lopnorensis]|uniref:SGNH/GDSL hydrolase family protein n=1 Tax=Allosalinactinospora lopnorensis TaxID=1352348 RepID=UPI000623D92D|nr:SGNH/GDSL hydrolase family protein [Allosalinactinospora lopnorensis]
MRIPDFSRRTLILGTAAATLVMVLLVALVVPPTRDGVLDAWCDLTEAGCPGPRGAEPDASGRLLRMPPEEAATWGNYVALGDSYAAGDGAGDYIPDTVGDGGCWRSSNAYPEKIVEENDFAGELGFFACSGRKGSAMLESLGSGDAQVEQVTRYTSLVTIGVGGNDLGFSSVLQTCMVRVPLLESSACVGQEDDLSERMDTFEETFEELLAEIRGRAPDARIIVTGYPRLFPVEPQSMYYTLTTNDQLWLNEMTQRFNKQLKDTVAEADADIVGDDETGSVEFVEVYTALNGHEISAEEAWINGVVWRDLRNGVTVDRSTFHPNADGQTAVGDRVQQQLEDGPERPLYATRALVESANPEVLASEFE